MCLNQLLRYLHLLFGQSGLRCSRQILRLRLRFDQFLWQVHVLQVLHSVGKRDRLHLWDGILFRRLRRNQTVL